MSKMLVVRNVMSGRGEQMTVLERRFRPSRLISRCNQATTMSSSSLQDGATLNLEKETMDDTCVVCAETLEWVAYGPCGHREVCSTCVARLRFICDDRRCCLCKSESKIIFMTKALGDYTRMINEFSIFQDDPSEGKIGLYWYHEGTQAYFDDLDHYKMIKAMCKLSCGVCDKMDEQSSERSRRRAEFKNIEQLKNHLLHRHKLSMCYLCLEGRKVFICEQKLYTKAQLNQHISTGDSDVDGSESDRGGFSGHPSCEFCRNPFYGDNELYLHMSTEHYTCHICQRQHPGQYEYYRNYDDLEIHFRGEHYLCEDEGCLANKFVVFATESEMKRHNAKEHGGNMSRSKRNAVLQIPTNFRYQQSNEEDLHGRRRGFRIDSVDNQLSMAIQASLVTVSSGQPRGTSSNAQAHSNHQEMRFESAVSSFDSLTTTGNEQSSRNHQSLGQNSRTVPLEPSSFPPLPVAKKSSRHKSRNGSKGSVGYIMAAHHHSRNNGTIGVGSSSSQAWPAGIRQTTSSVGYSQSRPISNSGVVSSSASSSSLKNKPAEVLLVPSSDASSSQVRQATGHGLLMASTASTSRNSSGSGKVSRSSPLNLVEHRSFESNICNSPPVSATQPNILPLSGQPLLKVKDAPSANKSLVEKIRSALENDNDRFIAFKEMSKEYRRGLIDTREYLGYVHQFGLSHLVLDLASLCPDAQKQKELVETYNYNLRCKNGPHNGSSSSDSSLLKDGKGSKKGKEKCQDNGISSSKDGSSGNNLRKLQPKLKQHEEVEVLSEDGYQSAKGKAKFYVVDEQRDFNSSNRPMMELRSENDSRPDDDSKKKSETRGGGKKQRKKISKFDRVRLGDNSAAALLSKSDPALDSSDKKKDKKKDSSEGFPVRGVWKNGGGHKLVANWS